MRRKHRKSQRVAVTLSLVASIGLAAGLFAIRSYGLTHWVLPSLSKRAGGNVSLGNLDVSPWGVITLDNLAVEKVLLVNRIEIAIDLDRGPSPLDKVASVRLFGPRLSLQKQRLTTALQDWQGKTKQPDNTDVPKPHHKLPPLEIVDGDLSIDMGSLGRLRATELSLSQIAGGVRLVFGKLQGGFALGDWSTSAVFGRGALDIALGSFAISRFIAVQGTVQIEHEKAEPLKFRGVRVAKDISGPVTISGNIGDEERGQFDAEVKYQKNTWQLAITSDNIPLRVASSWLPSYLSLWDANGQGHLRLEKKDDAWRIWLQGSAQNVEITHHRLASEPIRVSGQMEISAVARRMVGRDYISIDNFSVRSEALEMRGHGNVEWPTGEGLPERAEVWVDVPEIECMSALASLPAPMRGALAGMSLEGKWHANASWHFDRRDAENTFLDVDLATKACRVQKEPALANIQNLTQPFRFTMVDGTSIQVGATPDYVALAGLPSYVPLAYVAAEDANFFSHQGFDGEQIFKSLSVNLQEGKLLRGGSTISQQLIKNLFLGHERTFARKLQEAVLTWRLEQVLSKNLILERYLNIIELGPGIYGLGAAARYWFGKEPKKLTVAETAFLASLTPAPSTISKRIHKTGGLDEQSRRGVDIILRHMRRGHIISMPEYENAMREKIRLSPHVFARL